MKTPKFLSASIATVLALVPVSGWAVQRSITGTTAGALWGTAGNWTGGIVPTVNDNALLLSTLSTPTIVNYSSAVTSTNVQDLTFNGVGDIAIQNNDASVDMTLTLNGRGTFTPLIATTNARTYTIKSGTAGRTITLQLAQGGEFSVATGGTLNIASNISQDATSRYLTKVGKGTLILGGVNTFTGGLFVTEGKVTQTGTLVAANAVTVSGGTYEITGNAANANMIAVNTGGTFALFGGGILGSGTTLNLTGGLGRIENATGSVFTLNASAGGTARVTGTISAASTVNINSGGIITGTGIVNGTTTIGTGGKVETSTGTLTFANLRFGTAAGHTGTIQSVLGIPIVVSGVNGLVANGGANSVSINIASITATGTFPLIDYAGIIGGSGGGAFKIGQIPNRTVWTLTNNVAATQVELTVSSFDFPVWTGALDGEWQLGAQGAPKNWVLNSNSLTATDFQNLDIATFTNAASNKDVFISSGDVTPSSVVFSNTSGVYTIDSFTGNGIAGTASVLKSGAGRVVFNTPNSSFTGGVTINGGTLAVVSLADSGTSSALGAGSDISINGGTLEYIGIGLESTNRPVTINASGATILTTASESVTLSGAISGSGNLTKTGSGTLVISGENAYGSTTISGGVLQVGDGNSVGSLGVGNVTNNAELSFDIPAPLVMSQTVTGTGILRKRGFGALTLSGTASNTYAGGTELDVGTLIAAKAAGFIAIPGNLSIGLNAVFLPTAVVNQSNQIADSAVITIDGGAFGDVVDITNYAYTDTFSRVNLSLGSFTTTRTLVSGGINLTDRLNVTGGTATIHHGGVMTAARVDVASPGTIRFDGGNTTAANESKLTVGSGGLNLTGATITFNTGNGSTSVVAANSVGSILALNGNLTSTGLSKFIKAGVAGPKAETNLGGGIRTFQVTNAVDFLDLGSPSAPITITNGGITKTGLGTLTLPGNQPYTGATTVNAGEFIIQGAISSAVTIGASAIFSGTGSVASVTVLHNGTVEAGIEGSGTLSMPTLNLGSVAGDLSTVNLTRNSVPGVITVTGSNGLFPKGGVNSVTVNVSGTAPTAGQQYLLIDYSGAIGGVGFPAFVLGTRPNRTTADLVHDIPNTQIKLNVIAIDNPRWSGALDDGWAPLTQGSPKNWVLNSDGTTPTDFLTNDVVLFNDTALSTAVDIDTTDVTPASVRFENITKTYTLTGSHGIAGKTGLIKSGGGTVELFAPSSFTGSVTLNAGKVRVTAINDAGQSGALGAGSTISFNGGTLEVDSPGASTNRAITLTSAGGTVSNTGELALTGNITGTGRLTKSGTGTVVLGGANAALNNGITITGGRLQFDGVNNLGAATQTVTLNGGILEYNNAAKLIYADVGTRTVAVGAGGGGISVQKGDFDDDGGLWFSVANALFNSGGAGPLSKDGSGTLRLNAANSTLTSSWTVSEGMMESAVLGSVGSGSITVTGSGTFVAKNMAISNPIFLSGGTIGTRSGDATVYSGAVNVQGTSSVRLNSFTTPANQQTITISGVMSGNGTLAAVVAATTANSGKTLTISNAANVFSGSFDIERNQILLAQAVGGVGKTIGTASVQLQGSTFRIRDNGTAATDIAYGTNVVVHAIAPTIAEPAGTSTSVIDVDRATANAGKVVRLGGLTVNGNTLPSEVTTVSFVSANSFTTAFDGNSSFTGPVALNSPTYDPVFTGPISGTGSLTLLNSGRILRLSNTTSTFSGSFILPSGTTILSQPVASGSTLGSASVSLASATARIRDNGPGSNLELPFGNNFATSGTSTIEVARVGANTGNTVKMGSLSIASSATLNVTTVAPSAYKLAFDGATTLNGAVGSAATLNTVADLEMNGVISGSAGITKTGAGRLALNNVQNTFTGNVSVGNAATAAGTLGGVGLIPGSLSVFATATSATIAPGNSTGVLTVGGNVTLTANTTFAVELGRGVAPQPIPGEYDQINMGTNVATNGTLTLGNSALSLTAPGGLQNTDIFFIMINDGVDAVVGTFSGKADNSTFIVNGYTLQISYDANFDTGSFSGGNDVAIMVPEPTSAVMMVCGLATLLGRRRRRKM